MTSWLPNPATLRRPAYQSLADQFAQAIAKGIVAASARLPPHRKLADDLGLSVQTVSRAYEELIRRGLVVGEVGRGSFVLPPASENRAPYLAQREAALIDLSILKPVTERRHVEIFRKGLHWVADNLTESAALAFRPSSVMPGHRQIAADWLGRNGLDVAPDNITITDGATSAVTTAVMSAVPAGGTIAAATLTHHLLIPLSKYLGLHLEGLPFDPDGILPDALDHLARKGSLHAVYIQPSAINPMAIVSSLERRRELVEVARRHDIQIIENDMLNSMIEHRPPPVATLAPERVLYVNGFTKSTLPGLRIALATANRHLVTNWMATPAMVELLSHWITDGTVDRLILWQREALRERHRIAQEVLGEASFHAHPQSLHLWLELPPGSNEDDFVAQARRRGVAVASGGAFRIDDRGRRDAVRIALGSTSASDLRKGLSLVTDCLGSAAEPLLPLIG
ncbi:PLP-dependent aminotransferase family protein [uncultured Paracoccus sp.]|uniref:MocR-like ectoine utilization transcription factor EhuR n=1 Tax=uncultured Paracoccus sp. TaxID=189685 RepID=UPI0025DBFCF0|nr:PLP-dependent aminotransferase family protein [uncultured Paracoccus sp.]